MCVYNRPYDDQTDLKIKLETVACHIIFNRIQNNKFNLAWSFLLEFENELNPYSVRKNEIKIIANMAKYFIEPSQKILHQSEKIEQARIKGNDAVHLACALIGNCDFFISCDEKLIKRANTLNLGLEICDPIDFIKKG